MRGRAQKRAGDFTWEETTDRTVHELELATNIIIVATTDLVPGKLGKSAYCKVSVNASAFFRRFELFINR